MFLNKLLISLYNLFNETSVPDVWISTEVDPTSVLRFLNKTPELCLRVKFDPSEQNVKR